MRELMERMFIAETYKVKGLEACIEEIVPSEKEALKIHKKDMKEKNRKFGQLGFKVTYVASVLRVLVGVMATAYCCDSKENVLEVVEKLEKLTKDLRDTIEGGK